LVGGGIKWGGSEQYLEIFPLRSIILTVLRVVRFTERGSKAVM
jgi:hypothetical protein